jgi:hypothetical protein
MAKRKYTAERPLPTALWPFGWRILVTGLLGLHFLGVFLAPIAIPLGQHAPPRLASSLYQPLTPWLNAILLNQPWRFFAPEPGPISLELFRVEHVDGSVTWMEYPSPKGLRWRSPALQRGLAMAMRLEAEFRPSISNPQLLELSPTGRILSGAYARHVARGAAANGKPARSIQIWALHHYPRTPEQVESGWAYDDLRLWSACDIGTFSPEGIVSEEAERPHAAAIPKLAALWIVDQKTCPFSEDATPSIFETPILKQRMCQPNSQSVDEIAAALSNSLRSGETQVPRIRRAGGTH